LGLIGHAVHRLDKILVLAGLFSFISDLLFPLSLRVNLGLFVAAGLGAVAIWLGFLRKWIEESFASGAIVFLSLVSIFSLGVYGAKTVFHFYPGNELRSAIEARLASTDRKIKHVDDSVAGLNDNVLRILNLLTPEKRAQIYQLNFASHISIQ